MQGVVTRWIFVFIVDENTIINVNENSHPCYAGIINLSPYPSKNQGRYNLGIKASGFHRAFRTA